MPGTVAVDISDANAVVGAAKREIEVVDDVSIKAFKTEPGLDGEIVIKEEICYFEPVEDPLDDINQVPFLSYNNYLDSLALANLDTCL